MTVVWIRPFIPHLLLVYIWFSSMTVVEATPRQTGNLEKPKSEALPTVKRILDWLPPDTETLVVTNGPFKLEPGDENRPKVVPLEKCLEHLSYLPLNIRDGAYLKKLAGREVVLAVEGARKFRSARSLGLWPYEGCHILVFSRNIDNDRNSLTKAFAKDCKKVQKIGGHDVYCFEEKREKDRWKFYLVMPKPNVLLGATHQGYLEEVLQRMVGKIGVRAFPIGLPEWKHVDTTKRFWAIRHFDKARAHDEMDSPQFNDPQVVGLVFTFDPGIKPGEKRAPKVKYFSANKNARKLATKAWTYFDQPTWRPTVEQSGPGIVEITVDLNNKQAAEYFFLLLYHLGHAINS